MRVALAGGSYKARSLIADAMRTINLYPEKNPEDGAPFPFTYYPTPGLTLVSTPAAGQGRALYLATNGDLYGVVGSTLYYIAQDGTHTALGSLTAGLTTPVSMADNGLVLVVVDGSANGWTVTLSGRTWNGAIVDAAFYGADRVDFVDTFLLFNRPGTAQFYVSPSNWIPGVAFNPLYIASKTGSVDPIQGVICMHAEPWLIGSLTSEVWYDAGAADFPFARMPGVYVEHGCLARYSIAKQDLSIYWLGQDRQGQAMVLEGSGYQAKRASNHALEAELSRYATVSDAIGWTYQQQGHVFYVLTFPTANATWVLDITTTALSGEPVWHQRAYLEADGTYSRHRAGSIAAAYGKVLAQDWQTGKLYSLDQTAFTDNGNPIQRVQSFPHLRNQANRVNYTAFTADMETGTVTAPVVNPQVSLRWSDDGGQSWGNPVMRSLGQQGRFLTSPIWRRTGMSRRRVFELSWSFPYETALNGAYVEMESCAT